LSINIPPYFFDAALDGGEYRGGQNNFGANGGGNQNAGA
jgi:hypothetical protein